MKVISNQHQLVKPARIPGIPSRVIFAPTRTVLHQILDAALENLSEPIKTKPLADFTDIAICGHLGVVQFGVVGPVVGAAPAVMIAEILLSSGVKELLLIGAVGALRSKLNSVQFGDIILPRSAQSEEGTSALYGATSNVEPQSMALQSGLEKQLLNQQESIDSKRRVGIHTGQIWTTDAPFLESVEKIQSFANKGAIAVDMEYSALLHFTNISQINFAAAFVVTDILGDTWERGFSSPRVRQAMTTLSMAVISDPHLRA